MKIDLVITYVDNANEVWQHEFSKYSMLSLGTFFRTGKNALRYLLRGVEKNLPFINKVFLVVQNRSEVPSYINQEKVCVVTHDEFIPSQYLPTFNSNVIEAFLHNIPNLSERFIYSNDDMFVINKLTEKAFYEGDKAITFFYQIPFEREYPTFYESIVMNSNELILGESRDNTWNNGYVINLNHTLRPYFKSLFKQCYEKYWDKVEPCLTRLRTPRNHTIYIVDLYQEKIGRELNLQNIKNVCIENDKSSEELSALLKKNFDTICIMDCNEKVDIFENTTMQEFLLEKFPTASKYEN